MEDTTPSLACESCGASIPLTRVRRRDGYTRSIECQECRSVMTWSLATEEVIDLRDDAVNERRGAAPGRRVQDR